MKTPEAIAQECWNKALSALEDNCCGDCTESIKIITTAIRETCEPLKLELASETARANALRDDVFRLREELHDANTTLGQMRISEDAWLVERDALRGEATRLAAEVEHIKAWGNAKVEELDHYKRAFKSNGRSMELMAARIPTGHDVIDAVIEASAVSADSPGVLVWSANAPEQIEAALARIAAARARKEQP